MRTFVIVFILLTGFACLGQDATGITTKVKVVDANNDGKNVVRVEITYRGDTEVMVTTFRPNKEGVMALYSRTYFANGKAVMIESDDDRDGRLKYLTIFGPTEDDVEMFTREADGTVKPVITQRLDILKKQRAIFRDLEQKAMEGKKRPLDENKDGH